MSYFFAFRLEIDVCERLEQVAARLKEWGYPARWVHPRDYHLTLLYCGDCTVREADYLALAVDDYCGSLGAPSLQLPGLGAFGGFYHPKVLYAGVRDDAAYCSEVHYTLASELGFKQEREYKPHVTLCRPKQDKRLHFDWQRLFEAFGQAVWGDCAISHLAFCQSRNSGSGPRYHDIARWEIPAPLRHPGSAYIRDAS